MSGQSKTSDGALVVAEASAVRLIERDGRLHVVDMGYRWAYVTGFVAGLVTLIVGVNGVVQVVMGITGSGILIAGIIMVIVAGAGIFALRALVRHVRRKRALPLSALTSTVIFDFGQRVLCDGAGRPIAPLDGVQMAHRIQLGSSSTALEVRHAGGRIVIARGNPMAGGVGPLEDALRSRGIIVV